MYQTKYHRAGSLDQAAQLFCDAEDGSFISGGMTLIPTMKQRLASPTDLIDLSHISEMKGVSIEGDRVTIGALCTHAEVAGNAGLKSVCPAICSLAGHIGDPHVRHCGTIGGSIANNDPSADYPAGLLGLDAVIQTNKGSYDACDFFTGFFDTALEDGEIIQAVHFDAPIKGAYQKFPNPASRYALVGVFVAQLRNGSIRVAITGAGADGVYRESEIEEALTNRFEPGSIDDVEISDSDLLSDLHASSDYRAALIKVMAKRAVAQLV